MTIDLNSAEVRRDEKPIHLTASDELPNDRAQEIVKVHVRRLRHKIETERAQP